VFAAVIGLTDWLAINNHGQFRGSSTDAGMTVVGGFNAARRAIIAEICGNEVRKRDARMSLAERNGRWQGHRRAVCFFSSIRIAAGCPIIVRVRQQNELFLAGPERQTS
jgi:hypothetical protein